MPMWKTPTRSLRDVARGRGVARQNGPQDQRCSRTAVPCRQRPRHDRHFVSQARQLNFYNEALQAVRSTAPLLLLPAGKCCSPPPARNIHEDSSRNRAHAKLDRCAEPRGREAYLKQYVDRPSGEPACLDAASAASRLVAAAKSSIAAEAFMNNAGWPDVLSACKLAEPRTVQGGTPAAAAAFASALLVRPHVQPRLAQKLAPFRPMVERSRRTVCATRWERAT